MVYYILLYAIINLNSFIKHYYIDAHAIIVMIKN